MLSKEEVNWAYRILFGRLPENDATIGLMMQNPDIASLRRIMLLSPEFMNSAKFSLEIYHNAMGVDIELLNKYAIRSQPQSDDSNYYTNWLGIKTDKRLPNPEDYKNIPTSLHEGCYEYLSVLMAIDRTRDRRQFTAVELGACWGPWISAVGVVCKRQKFDKINLVGVEAAAVHYKSMKEHLNRNGLLNVSNINCALIEGAAWTENATVYFPEMSRPDDYGAAASGDSPRKEYRGRDVQHFPVQGYSLSTICKGLEIIDYMHFDVQGAEVALINSAKDLLNKRVRFVFIGTHSLPIEGDLLRFFYENKWDVLHYVPCTFQYNRASPSLEAMTVGHDGELFACNTRL